METFAEVCVSLTTQQMGKLSVKILLLDEIPIDKHFNPIQDGEGGAQKGPPRTIFPPVTSTNVGSNPQNFLTFSFNSFVTLA